MLLGRLRARGTLEGMPEHDQTAAERLHLIELEVTVLLQQFQDVHAEGMQAMQRGDKPGFDDAVRRESALLAEFTNLIAVATGRRQW